MLKTRRLPAPISVRALTKSMYLLHIFPSAEELYDVVCGCASLHQHTFPSKDAAELWFKEEYGDSGWSFLGDADLEEARAEQALVNR
jgi:hypothetical protein